MYIYVNINIVLIHKKENSQKKKTIISAQWLNLDSAIWAIPPRLAEPPVFLSIGIIPTLVDLFIWWFPEKGSTPK